MVRYEYLVYSVVDMAYARNWSVLTLYSYALYLVYAVAFVAPLRVAYGGVEAMHIAPYWCLPYTAAFVSLPVRILTIVEMARVVGLRLGLP